MKVEFTQSEMEQISVYLTLTALFTSQSLRPTIKFAIAELAALSRETTWIDKLLTWSPCSQKPKSSKISDRDSTSSEKGLEPYWNDLCAETSSRLLLPTVTDWQDSDSSLLSGWSSKTVAESWFSTTLFTAPNQNLPPIFCPSFMSSVAECTDSGSTVRKSSKIRIYPNATQRNLIRQWFGVSRLVFNTTVKYLQQPDTKANWKAIKGEILKSLPEFCSGVPYQIKSIAVKDACKAVSNAKAKFKLTGQVQQVSFRSRKNPYQSCYIPKSAVKPRGVYHTILGQLGYAEELPENFGDCRLVRVHGQYYLCVPEEVSTTKKPDNQGRVVALDPGIRTFLTFFSEKKVGKIGESDFSRIQRLCHHLDDLISRFSFVKAPQRRRMKKAAARIRIRIRNLIDELQHKSARFLVDNFDVILLPTFETSNMSLKATRKIRSKTVRNLLTFAHYRFQQFLKHKARMNGSLVVDVCEAYTSKTVSWTGEIRAIGGAKTIKSARDGMVCDRDVNGARGIFLRALVDTPWMREHLAFVNES
jgi:putative transposase